MARESLKNKAFPDFIRRKWFNKPMQMVFRTDVIGGLNDKFGEQRSIISNQKHRFNLIRAVWLLILFGKSGIYEGRALKQPKMSI